MRKFFHAIKTGTARIVTYREVVTIVIPSWVTLVTS